MDMQEIFVAQLAERYRSTNFECLGKDDIPLDEPTQFGFEFEPKGTIRFTFLTGVSILFKSC